VVGGAVVGALVGAAVTGGATVPVVDGPEGVGGGVEAVVVTVPLSSELVVNNAVLVSVVSAPSDQEQPLSAN
jgi:hypothetical protein